MEVAEVRKRWGENVRQAREGKLTQEELAAAVGCSQAAISRVELGQQELTLKLSLAIAAALETPYRELFDIDAVLG
jgi:transcriptional regulator with XRE-family HTH domain